MPFNTKVSGTWRTGVAPYVKVAGTWRIAKSALRKINGAWKSWFLQGGVLDNYFGVQSVPSFNNNLGSGILRNANASSVFALAVQSDNKIIIGGDFSTFNGTTVNDIARLNADGSLDTVFDTNTGIGLFFGNSVNEIKVQADGKILIGGDFDSFNNISSSSMVRLNSNGTLDTAFTTAIGSGFNGGIFTIAVQSDAKIVVGGVFNSFNGVNSSFIARLNADGTRDTTFTTNIGTGFDDMVNAVALQSDGKIIVGGQFTTFNGVTVNRIARLNTDGTLDTTFDTNTGTGFDERVLSLAVQADNKIVAGGYFTSFNGTTANLITRLNADGTLDTTFNTNTGTGTDDSVDVINIQSDGKIIIGGNFSVFNGTSSSRIARLNTDGTRDTTFTTNIGTGFESSLGHFVKDIVIQSNGNIIIGGVFQTFNESVAPGVFGLNSDGSAIALLNGTNHEVYATASQSDGKIVLGGSFTTFDGITANKIARLNFDGTLDTAFTTAIGNGFNSQVRAIAFQAVDSDQKIVVGGGFSLFDVITCPSVARLDSNGNLDRAFLTNIGSGFNSQVEKLAVQSDQKIVVGGFFTSHDGVTSNRIARLNTDGTRDTTFTTNIGTGFNNFVQALAVQADGKILVGGFFTTFNGVTVNRIARLNTDGTLDTTFDTNTGTGFSSTVNSLAVQADGKIVVGGQFTTFNGVTVNRIARLNADGTLDTTFDTNTGNGTAGITRSIVLQLDGKIVLGGSFTTFDITTVAGVLRLNADGILDTAFNTNTGSGASDAVETLALQPDGKIVVGGSFTSFNGVSRSRIARIGGDIAS
jgi:uncharacterized delta-60 repeat protein